MKPSFHWFRKLWKHHVQPVAFLSHFISCSDPDSTINMTETKCEAVCVAKHGEHRYRGGVSSPHPYRHTDLPSHLIQTRFHRAKILLNHHSMCYLGHRWWRRKVPVCENTQATPIGFSLFGLTLYRYTVSGSEKLEITPKVSSQMSTPHLDQILDLGNLVGQSAGFSMDQESWDWGENVLDLKQRDRIKEMGKIFGAMRCV